MFSSIGGVISRVGRCGLSFKNVVKFLLGPLLFIVSIILPPLPMVSEAAGIVHAPISNAPQVALAVMIWIASWWVFEVVPLGVTALLAPIIFSTLGFVSWQDSLTSFMDPIIWVFIGGFAIASAFQIWGLNKRIAFNLSTIYRGSNPMFAAFFIACLPAFILTITGSITASTTIVYPIAMAYLSSIGFMKGSSFAEATMLSLAQASTAGAMLFLISTPPNLVAKKVIESCCPNVTITFLDWFIVGGIQAFIGLIVSWILTFKLIGIEVSEINLSRASIEDKVKSLGPMSTGEKMVLLVFLITLSLWLTPGILMMISNFYPQYGYVAGLIKNALPEALPSILAVFLLCLLRVNGRPLLTWDDFETGVDWNVIFLFGGGIAMSKALTGSGFSEWMALIMSSSQFEWARSVWGVSALSAILSFLITYPASNTAAALIACPLAATIAQSVGVSPIPAVLSAALAASISSALPSTTPPMAIVYGSGYVRLWSMFKVGMISDIVRLIILIILEPYLVNMMLALKGLA